MSLQIGIVGLPNVGKSTLFNALTDNNILAANYPFATIEPNTGIVPVADKRLDKLAQIFSSKKVLPATVTFVDIAGLVAGASEGEGLGNKFLSHIRECSAIAQIVRAFKDSDVTHVAERIHPKDDIEIINTELVLADLQTVNNRLPKIHKEAKANPKLIPVLNTLEQIKNMLENGEPLYNLDDEQKEQIKDLQLLTTKPIIYVFNLDEDALAAENKRQELAELVAPNKAIFVSAKLEDELRQLSPEDRAEMLNSYGQDKSGLELLINAAYDTLGLQSYLTAGEKEVRAWTIKKGATAPQAAGVIHTDFERGFIAADVVDYDDLVAAGSKAAARSAGKLRTEGKTYVMKPGDVVEFKFNV